MLATDTPYVLAISLTVSPGWTRYARNGPPLVSAWAAASGGLGGLAARVAPLVSTDWAAAGAVGCAGAWAAPVLSAGWAVAGGGGWVAPRLVGVRCTGSAAPRLA